MRKKKNQTHAGACPPCDIPQRARNHYFTGKLLVERDFRDEQRYHMGKVMRHGRFLHGWGVACGLEVTQHPNESCRDRYVVVRPGFALDDCGREVMVEEEVHFDFRSAFLAAWEKARAEAGEPAADGEEPEEARDFQICVRYRECPDEPMPDLFGDCGTCGTHGGGEGDGYQPGRILESFELDLILDPDLTPDGPSGARLVREHTLNLAAAKAVAVHDGTRRIYVLSQDESPSLYVLSSLTGAVLASRSFADVRALDLAVSADGDRLYAAVRAEGEAAVIYALDPDDPGSPPLAEAAVAGSESGRLRLEPAPDGGLLALSQSAARLFHVGADLGASTKVDVGTGPVDFAVSASGAHAFVADRDGGKLFAVALPSLAVQSLDYPGSQPTAVATAAREDGDLLAVVEAGTTFGLALFQPDEAEPFQSLIEPPDAFAYPISEVALSPGGAWVYLLEEEEGGGRGYLQAVSVHRLLTGHPDPAGHPVPVGDRPRDLVLGGGADRSSLYAAYLGDGSPGLGGVAVFTASAESCCSVLDAPGPCPEGEGKCIVLATVRDYLWGDPVLDLPEGEEWEEGWELEEEEEGEEDEDDVIAAFLDNHLGRRTLPSTERLAEAIRCLCDRASVPGEPGEPGEDGADGADGAPGTPGAPGAEGPGIDDVEVDFIPCDEDGRAEIVEGTPRTLRLWIPSCCEKDLTRICGISWLHAGQHSYDDLDLRSLDPNLERNTYGLIAAFDRLVRAQDLHLSSFRVWVLQQDRDTEVGYLFKWLQLFGAVQPVRLALGEREGGGCEIRRVEQVGGTLVNGVRFIAPNVPNPLFIAPAFSSVNRVEIVGELIRDENGRAVDGEHLPPWLPERPSGNHSAGGTFESYFGVGIDLNNASGQDLTATGKFTAAQAEAIVAFRDQNGPFTAYEELGKVRGVGDATLQAARGSVVVLDEHTARIRRSLISKGDA